MNIQDGISTTINVSVSDLILMKHFLKSIDETGNNGMQINYEDKTSLRMLFDKLMSASISTAQTLGDISETFLSVKDMSV